MCLKDRHCHGQTHQSANINHLYNCFVANRVYSKWICFTLPFASLSTIFPLSDSVPMSHTLCLLREHGQVQQLGFLAFLITADPELRHSGESEANPWRFKRSSAALVLQSTSRSGSLSK